MDPLAQLLEQKRIAENYRGIFVLLKEEFAVITASLEKITATLESGRTDADFPNLDLNATLARALENIKSAYKTVTDQADLMAAINQV
jgi:hypothetical protein